MQRTLLVQTGRMLFLLCAPALSFAADPAKEFLAAKASIQQQIRDPKPAKRVAAVRKLEAFPIVEAAKILVLQACNSADAEVRAVAYDTLLKFKNDKEICAFLRATVTKDLKKGAANSGTCAALGAIMASDSAEAQKENNALVEQVASSPESGRMLLISLVDELGLRADEGSLQTLLKVSKLSLFTKDFPFRRAAVQALARVRKKEAVTALIDVLEMAQGEVRADIVRFLASISGLQFGADQVAWKNWWKTNQAAFKFPELPKDRGEIARGPVLKGLPAYYGLPLYGSRLVFVLDTSASMRGARIDAAKRELVNAIKELPAGVSFNIVVFNGGVGAWQRQLVQAADESKKAAAQFVLQQDLGPLTASYDALETALSFDAEAIYFLTDGAPVGGKITKPAEIVDVITKMNRYRRMTINSIGIGVGQPGNLFDAFLKALATENFGDYRRVDQ